MIPKKEKNVQNEHKKHPMVIKYPKCPQNIPIGHKIYQYFQLKGPPKYTQMWIFGMKIKYQATLMKRFIRALCFAVGWAFNCTNKSVNIV
jgi:hypothetical protein